MSRMTFGNDRFSLAFGVDHAIGTFFLIYANNDADEESTEDDEPAIVNASAKYGVKIKSRKELQQYAPGALRLIDTLLMMWMKEKGKSFSEEHITGIAVALFGYDTGVDQAELARKVYELWD